MEVIDTATMIARVRAEEAHRLPNERLFDDPYARLFVPADPVSEIEAQIREIPSWVESIRLRTRSIDDLVKASLAAGHRRLVILGSGFDCRALRLAEIAASGATVFEVDFPEQLERKWSILGAGGVSEPAWNRRIACDFSKPDLDESLGEALRRAGFRRGEGSLFVWEGVVNYLDDAAAERTLRIVTDVGGDDTWLVLNYQVHRASPEGIRALLAAAGFREIEDETIEAAHRAFFGRDPGPGAEVFRMVTARR